MLQKSYKPVRGPDDPGNYFRIRFFSQDLAMKNVDDRLERRSRSYRSDREMPVEMMMDVVEQAKARYDTLFESSKTSRLNTLVSLEKALAGDTILPDSSTFKMETDSAQIRRMLRKVRVQEVSALRTTERLYGRLENEKKRQAQYLVEIHKKFSTSFACFVFVLIGAPLGIMARKGGIGTGIIYSLAFFVVYWICLIGGENLADRLIISPELAMWASNVIIGIFGIFITIAMIRDRFSGDSKVFRAIRFVGGFFKKLTGRFG